jgi:TonB-linked SusC/RagA family outer membrane protein
MKFKLLTIIFLTFSISLFAQTTIEGVVNDVKGLSVPQANVVIKGTKKGVLTDFDGVFKIKAKTGDVLIISSVGFENKEVKIQGNFIKIVLEESNTTLNEVVVIGYGTQKSVNVIGSVSQITNKDIKNRPITSLSNALTGQMAGVTVIQNSGKPGANGGTISVRGVGSFGATPDALILVDGIPGSMDDINMDDVESVSVLKDASSAAIYGARAANGVILITTKKGKEGEIRVAYNGYYGISTPTALPDMVNSWEYAEMFNIANGAQSFSAADIAKYKAQDDPDNYPNTNFIRKTFSRNGIQIGHNISITGGQKTNKYLLSLGYLNEQGLVVHNDYKRYNLRLNLETKLSENLTLTTRIAGSIDEANEPVPLASKAGTLETITYTAARVPSIYLGQASNGDFGTGQENNGTPVSWLASKGYFNRPTTKGSVNSRLDYKPIKELTLSAIGAYNFELDEGNLYQASQVLNATTSNTLATRNQNRDKGIYKTMQFLAQYTKAIKDHNITILGGYSFENQQNQTFSGFRQDFPSNDYTVMSMGGINNQQVYGDDVKWAIQSLFGRFNYNYKQKYLFESTVRYDGSSRFPVSQKYAAFPSLAIGWRVTEEDFFRTAFPWFSNLKLRASWGKLGNQNIGNYPYQSTLASGKDYPFGTAISTGAAYTTYRDPNIHWESTETKDLGIETGFFDGKLTFNATYFDRYTSDVLYKPTSSVSSVLGLSISEINTGELKNSGWEFELGHKNKFGDFSYNIQGNLSIINNEVKTLGLGNVTQLNGMIGNGTDLFIGFPMEMYYGYKTDGVFTSADDVKQWVDQTKVTPQAVPGDIRYKDISGPNGVPDGVVDPNYDRTYLGSRIPKYTYSLNLSAAYKSFDFRVFFQGVSGVKGMLSETAGLAFYNLGSIQRWQMDGSFNPENPVRYPAYPRLEIIPKATPNTELSDFWTLNASYLRVKNIQLGYTLPKSVLSAMKIDNLRVYFSAENLFSFNHYRKGWDPEMNTDGRFYPILATFSTGINVKF